MYGGPGDDLYFVDSPFDYIDENGGGLPGLVTDTDTIRSSSYFWWDYFSAGEILILDEAASTIDVAGVDIGVSTLVGGGFDNEIRGNGGANNLYANWGDDTVWAGAGIDHIDFTDRAAGATGANRLVYEAGNGYDIVWNFLPGTDVLDVAATAFDSFAAIRAAGVDDGIGNSYFVLGDADYLYVIGKTLADLGADSFAFG